jgi:hypothetical protein
VALRDTLEQQRPERRLPKFIRAFPTDRPVQPDTTSTGIEAVDRLTGGLPQGRITEVFGPESSGRTSLLLSSLARITDKEEFCGLIDPAGAFDPASARSAGVDLDRVLWIRTGRNIDRTLKTLDLLIQAGGFGLIGVDLDPLPASGLRSVPLSSWFRFQRAVEHTSTILLFIGREPMVRTAASLVLTLESPGRFVWSATLLHGIRPRVEIIRSRTNSTIRPGRSDSFGLDADYRLCALSGMPEMTSGVLSNDGTDLVSPVGGGPVARRSNTRRSNTRSSNTRSSNKGVSCHES